MSSKVVISILFLVCFGLCMPSTEGSLFTHPFYRSQNSFWPDFDLLDEHFSDPFFDDSYDLDPFRDDKFFIDFPVLRKPAIGNQRNCLTKSTPQTVQRKPATEILKLNINIEGFKPRELTLMTQGNDVIIRGEKNVCDFTSCYKRTYYWRGKLPENAKMNTVKARINSENVVEITAQRKKEMQGETNVKDDVERESKRKLQNGVESGRGMPTKSAPSKASIKSQTFMKNDISMRKAKESQLDEDDEETTLEVVNEDERQ